jgi:EF hand
MEGSRKHDAMAGRVRAALSATLVGAAIMAGAAPAADRVAPADWPRSALNSPAMHVMLRADRNKDGMLSREELEEYDLTLGPRFAEADWDQNGKLTLHELESLLLPQSPSVGATR